jgi:REP element-mobilizing transposase RayT
VPRSGRVVVPETPHHLIQRGHNREVVFAADGEAKRGQATLFEVFGDCLGGCLKQSSLSPFFSV